MIDTEVIRDLAKAAGCKHELTDTEIKEIREKLAASLIDDIMDGKFEPLNDKDVPHDGEKKRS